MFRFHLSTFLQFFVKRRSVRLHLVRTVEYGPVIQPVVIASFLERLVEQHYGRQTSDVKNNYSTESDTGAPILYASAFAISLLEGWAHLYVTI